MGECRFPMIGNTPIKDSEMTKGKLMLTAAVTAVSLNGFAQQEEVAEQGGAMAARAVETFEWGLLVEAEGGYAKVGGESESDIILATMEFRLEAALTDWLRGNLGLLWEEDSREDDNVDEGFITLGASESIPYYLVIGRFWQPVGSFESAFISDPLTLELMEMNQTAAMIGYGNSWVDANVGAFKGDTKAGILDGDTTVSDGFASVAFTPADPVQCGAYWLSDMMETYNYGSVGGLISDQPGYEKVGGAGAYLNLYLGRFTIYAEFASALDAYKLGGEEYTPAAYNLEGSYQVNDQVVVGIKYESSEDLYAGYNRTLSAVGDKYPGQAYGTVVSYGFHENASVAAEYLRVEELDDDANGHLFTVQLALEI